MNIVKRTGLTALGVGLAAGFGTASFTVDAEAAWKPRQRGSRASPWNL